MTLGETQAEEREPQRGLPRCSPSEHHHADYTTPLASERPESFARERIHKPCAHTRRGRRDIFTTEMPYRLVVGTVYLSK